MKEIKIISFDGLSRSGKGTQLKLLRRYFENISVPVQIVRGDGSRKGEGNIDYHDPRSTWWIKWQNIKQKTSEDWNRAYTVLSKEVEDEFVNFSDKHDSGFFLMDRSYVSRWFVKRQRDVNTPFEDVSGINHTFPHKYFILDAPKEVLLSRRSDDDPAKAQFRREIVERWYDLWQDTMEKVENKLGDHMVRIDATKEKDDIHQIILQNIKF